MKSLLTSIAISPPRSWPALGLWCMAMAPTTSRLEALVFGVFHLFFGARGLVRPEIRFCQYLTGKHACCTVQQLFCEYLTGKQTCGFVRSEIWFCKYLPGKHARCTVQQLFSNQPCKGYTVNGIPYRHRVVIFRIFAFLYSKFLDGTATFLKPLQPRNDGIG